MNVKITLVLLVCGLACASAYYIVDGLDDDYYNRGYRLASYGYAPPINYRRTYILRPSYGYGFNTLGARGFYYEDLTKKKK